MEGETGSNLTYFPDLVTDKVNLLCPMSYVAQSAEQLNVITLKESYASSNPGRVDFLSSILIAKLGCIFMSITIGPLFCFFFSFFLIYNLSNFITTNSQALCFSGDVGIGAAV